MFMKIETAQGHNVLSINACVNTLIIVGKQWYFYFSRVVVPTFGGRGAKELIQIWDHYDFWVNVIVLLGENLMQNTPSSCIIVYLQLNCETLFYFNWNK